MGGNHRVDWITTYPFGHTHQGIFPAYNGAGHPQSNGDVVIGNDVWIGTNVTIMSGVTVGDGAVLGACSVIAKDVPPYTIVAGNPGKVVKHRFTPEITQKLLDLQWWNLDDVLINKISPLLCSSDIQANLEVIAQIIQEERKSK